MIANLDNYYNKVKILKKVRRRFLHKGPAEDEQRVMVPLDVDPDTRILANTTGYTIKATIGLVEIGRKVLIGPEYLNLYFNIESTKIENELQNKAVILNMCSNENRSVIPWEYSTKRLESYGDLQLATWAHRIRKHYMEYDRALHNIHNLVTSNEPDMLTSLNGIKMRAALARREIESKCAYNRYVQFFKKDTNHLVSCGYTESFLQHLGFTSESFIRWSKDNGIPRIMATSSEFYEDMVKGFLTCVPRVSEPVLESPESESFVYHKDGSKVAVTVRSVTIVDPVPEGTFYYCYVIICDPKIKKGKKLLLQNDKQNMICGEDGNERDLEIGNDE